MSRDGYPAYGDMGKSDIPDSPDPEDEAMLIVMVKALSGEARFRIVSLLARGQQDFGTLLRATNREKTALSNHLTILVDAGLVEKPGHGYYGLSPDGNKIYRALLAAYDRTAARARIATARAARGAMSEEFLAALFGRG